MRVLVTSTKPYDRRFLQEADTNGHHQFHFVDAALRPETASLVQDHDAVCAFVNDVVDAAVLDQLHAQGVRVVALRCAGFNNVDLNRARELGISVVRVPAYSPHAVAEHTLGLVLCLNRRIHRAYNRIREGNFALQGLLGFDLHGKTVGLIGTGRIGAVAAGIFLGFGCTVLASDRYENAELIERGVEYVSVDELFARSDIVSLHCPLTPETHHLIDDQAVERMKPGVMVINTSRGALIDTKAATRGLKSGQIGSLGIDVYEEEGDLFFEDLSGTVIQDDVFARLTTFPNVLITGHQAFFTEEALRAIASTTVGNLDDIAAGRTCANEVTEG